MTKRYVYIQLFTTNKYQHQTHIIHVEQLFVLFAKCIFCFCKNLRIKNARKHSSQTIKHRVKAELQYLI